MRLIKTSVLIIFLFVLLTAVANATVVNFTGLTDNIGANGEVDGTEFNSQGLDLTLINGIAFNVGCGTGNSCLGGDLISVDDFDATIRGNFVINGSSLNATVATLILDFCCEGNPGNTISSLFDASGNLIQTYIDTDVNYTGSTAVSYFETTFSFDALYSVTYTGQQQVEAGVPEPVSLALMGLGLAGLGFRRKR